MYHFVFVFPSRSSKFISKNEQPQDKAWGHEKLILCVSLEIDTQNIRLKFLGKRVREKREMDGDN
jgi:hypothetical protein